MGSHPLANLSALERDTYRTALAAHVVEAVYHAHQQGGTLTLDAIVQTVRAVRPDVPAVEVHRAVAHVEYTGLIATLGDRWHHVDNPPELPRPIAVCATAECLRPAGHHAGHLPDLNGDRPAAQLVVPADDFLAAWPPGSPWVHIYATAAQWTIGENPVAVLPVPHTTRFTPDALIDLVTAWTSRDTHTQPATDTTTGMRGGQHGIDAGATTGQLIYQHADFVAVWAHSSGEIRFYQDVSAWDDDAEGTIDRVPAPAGAPFTGSVLDQVCDDWFTRQLDP